MKILHVSFAKSFRGGERQTELLIRALADRGQQQGILLRHDAPLVTRLEDIQGLDIIRNHKPYIRKTVSTRQFDVCHAHEAKAAQWARLNSLVHKMPYVITRRVLKVPKNNFFTRSVYSNAAVVICLSGAIRENLLKTVPTANVHRIPDMCAGFSADEMRLRQLQEEYRGKFIVGSVGALVKKDKGHHVLVDAMRALGTDNSVHCLILGEGRDRDSLEEQAEGLENLEFLGFKDDVGTYLKLFDAFVFPSLSEGMGSSLLDAMQAGCPIVASDVGGIPDVIDNEIHGLLVPPGDAAALGDAIERLRESPDLAQRLVQAAKSRVEAFRPERLAEQHVEIYRGIVDNNVTAD